jgi:hypothetical protein
LLLGCHPVGCSVPLVRLRRHQRVWDSLLSGKAGDGKVVRLHKHSILDEPIDMAADLVFSVGLVEHFKPSETRGGRSGALRLFTAGRHRHHYLPDTHPPVPRHTGIHRGAWHVEISRRTAAQAAGSDGCDPRSRRSDLGEDAVAAHADAILDRREKTMYNGRGIALGVTAKMRCAVTRARSSQAWRPPIDAGGRGFPSESRSGPSRRLLSVRRFRLTVED